MSANKGLEFSIEGIIPGIPKSQADKDIFKIFGEALSNYEERINCEKLSENKLTKRTDLYIEVNNPEKIKPSGFSLSYFQYTIETNPIGLSVKRKLSDFELLNETLPKYNKGKFNPVLYDFPMNLADDSEKKILFLKYYLNSIIEDEYYRSLPIVLDFLSLTQPEWDKKAKIYQKMKENTKIEKMFNLNGYYDIKISYEDDFKAKRIKEDIKKKEEEYKKLIDNINELFPIMEKMSVCLKNISQNLLNLKNLYTDSSKYTETLANSFDQLYTIIKTWGEDYIKQKNFLQNEFKYFFKYILKEINSFMKNFEKFEDTKDNYKKKFERFQKNEEATKEDHESVNKYKNLYGFHLVNIIEEYNKLNERQGKRVNKQFFLFNKEKELLFQDYDNFYRLFNFKENYNLPDISISYLGKTNEILNLNISKISKNNNDKEVNYENGKEEKEEKVEKEENNNSNCKINDSKINESNNKINESNNKLNESNNKINESNHKINDSYNNINVSNYNINESNFKNNEKNEININIESELKENEDEFKEKNEETEEKEGEKEGENEEEKEKEENNSNSDIK